MYKLMHPRTGKLLATVEWLTLAMDLAAAAALSLNIDSGENERVIVEDETGRIQWDTDTRKAIQYFRDFS